jgi:hypothetical protein
VLTLIRDDSAFGHAAWTQICQAQRESPSPWEVKVGVGVLPGSKHTRLRCIRDEQWVQMRCLNLSMLGLGCAPEPEYLRLGCRSPSPHACWGARRAPRMLGMSCPRWACALQGLELLARAQAPCVMGSGYQTRVQGVFLLGLFWENVLGLFWKEF